jgi:transcriptional regulator with XRE-family HTH domain
MTVRPLFAPALRARTAQRAVPTRKNGGGAELRPLNTHNYAGRIERGECSASLEILFRLAKALNVRPYKLLLKL